MRIRAAKEGEVERFICWVTRQHILGLKISTREHLEPVCVRCGKSL